MARKGLVGSILTPFRRIVKAVNSTVKNSLRRVNTLRKKVVKRAYKLTRRRKQ